MSLVQKSGFIPNCGGFTTSFRNENILISYLYDIIKDRRHLELLYSLVPVIYIGNHFRFRNDSGE